MNLILIFLIINDDDYFLMNILHPCLSSWSTVQVFSHSFYLVTFMLFYFRNSLNISDISLLSDTCMKMFSPCLWTIYFLNGVIWWTKVLNFDEFHIIHFLYSCAFSVLSEKTLCIPKCNDPLLCFLLGSSMTLAFVFRSMIPLELIFVHIVR